MMQNITLSAEKSLIERARKRAESKNSTLNAEFRRWLVQFIETPQTEADLLEIMEKLKYSHAGKKFSREELNER